MNSALQITSSVSIPISDVHFRTSRSSGPGGQNVNKLETRVELLFDVLNSRSLNAAQKALVRSNLGTRVNGEGILHVSSQRSRSQWENKQFVIEKFVELVRKALKVRKKRIKTSPTAGSREYRVQSKKKHARKKQMRKVNLNDE